MNGESAVAVKIGVVHLLHQLRLLRVSANLSLGRRETPWTLHRILVGPFTSRSNIHKPDLSQPDDIETT